MRLSLISDVGKARRRNEDAARCGEFGSDAAWGVVCDGMGGAAGGNTASTMAVEMIAQKLSACYKESMRDSSIQNMLLSSVTTANVAVFDKSMSDVSLRGMGTTVVAAVVRKSHYCIAHAGDSRAYLVGEEIHQLTKDHSVVQQMFDNGQLSAEQMKNNPIKNFITRALGVDEDIELEFDTGDMLPGQLLLLCSDGLTNFVEDSDILRLFKEQGSDLDAYLKALVELANENGGGDNITAVAMTNFC